MKKLQKVNDLGGHPDGGFIHKNGTFVYRRKRHCHRENGVAYFGYLCVDFYIMGFVVKHIEQDNKINV